MTATTDTTGTGPVPEAELRYVYAVTRPFDGVVPEGGGRGLDGEPPRLLRHGDLVAVVSPVPAADFDEAPLKAHLEDLDWLAGTARTHQNVITALTTVTSPLPLRLATVCRDDSGVRRLLESGHQRFATALDRLEGRIEWGVKVYAANPDPAPQAQAPAPSADTPGAGRSYLRQRLAQRRTRESASNRADALCRRIHSELSRTAERAILHRLQDGRLSGRGGQNVLNAAYLVPRTECEAFVERVHALTPGDPEDEGVQVELTGPWAPYSFADIGEEDTAQDRKGERT